jgi:OOP family OmpA-OmpF porin
VRLRSLVASLAFVAVPVGAWAQPVTGPYISLGGGLALHPENRFQYDNLHTSGNLQWNPGFTATGGAGYGFGDGIRIELDADLTQNSANKMDGIQGDTNVSGNERNYGALVNVFYDFPVSWPVTPYVGAGAGIQFVDYHPFVGNSTARVFGTKSGFAYDLIAGVSYAISAVPGLALTAEYRFMQIPGNRYYTGNGAFPSVKVGSEYSNSFIFGLRYQLFQPKPLPPTPVPAPVAAPAPAPAKTYLVFFDWDKYNLTPRAVDIIAQAASDSKTQQTTTIAVNGYTDTSGTPVYNQGLSVRRAKAVETQLVTDGVPASEITAQGFGDTDLLVQTGPGVREPQNRRVQIVLQ